MRGQRSGLHAQCNIEPPSTSYVLHSTAQVKMTGVTWMGTTCPLRDLGGPPPSGPLLLLLLLAPAVLPLSGRLDPQAEPTEIARFHSLRDPSLRPSATPNHNHARPHSISVKYFSSRTLLLPPSRPCLVIPLGRLRLALSYPSSSTLTPCASWLSRAASITSLDPSSPADRLPFPHPPALPPPAPSPPPPPNQHWDSHLNAVLGCRRLLNHTLFASIGTFTWCTCEVEHSAD